MRSTRPRAARAQTSSSLARRLGSASTRLKVDASSSLRLAGGLEARARPGRRIGGRGGRARAAAAARRPRGRARHVSRSSTARVVAATRPQPRAGARPRPGRRRPPAPPGWPISSPRRASSASTSSARNSAPRRHRSRASEVLPEPEGPAKAIAPRSIATALACSTSRPCSTAANGSAWAISSRCQAPGPPSPGAPRSRSPVGGEHVGCRRPAPRSGSRHPDCVSIWKLTAPSGSRWSEISSAAAGPGAPRPES